MKRRTGDTSQASAGRRGLFAAGWAAIAGLILAKTTQKVEAAAPLQFQDIAGGGLLNNSAGGPTSVFSNSNYTSSLPTFIGFAFQGNAQAGLAGINGSFAVVPTRCGVYGTQNKTDDANTAGIVGDNYGQLGTGVLGRSGPATSLLDGIGVLGESAGGVGVKGAITGAKNAVAMWGENLSTYAGPGPGAGGFGVYGSSLRGHGLVGATGTAGGAAVAGSTNGIAGAYAAVFYGPVVVTEALTVLGPKSAAVAHPDGSHRLLYCVESPESWFEDFGKAELDCGRADVTIDPNFAAVADMRDYHVFLTMYGRHELLTVSEQTPEGFRVTSPNVNSNGRFSWRVVAKRKDITGERLATIAIPPEPRLPSLA